MHLAVALTAQGRALHNGSPCSPAPRSQRHRVHPVRHWPPIHWPLATGHWSLDAALTAHVLRGGKHHRSTRPRVSLTYPPLTANHLPASRQGTASVSSCVRASTSFHPTRLLLSALLFESPHRLPCPSTVNPASVSCVFCVLHKSLPDPALMARTLRTPHSGKSRFTSLRSPSNNPLTHFRSYILHVCRYCPVCAARLYSISPRGLAGRGIRCRIPYLCSSSAPATPIPLFWAQSDDRPAPLTRLHSLAVPNHPTSRSGSLPLREDC